ncbi:MAG: hypothetical protein JWO31_789 [Phycisphaerales bacterium]|nr:hypothetical protein [Phycisphaerales bacterium]
MTHRPTRPRLATTLFASVGLLAAAPLVARLPAAPPQTDPPADFDARHAALTAMVAEKQAAAARALADARRLIGKAADARIGGTGGDAPYKDGLLATTAIPARPATKARTLRMLVTAYCPCKACCGPNARGITASGRPVSLNKGRFVAADTAVLPFRTRLLVPGYHDGSTVEVADTGSAIKGDRLDVYFPSHQTALEWGKRWVDVTVVE